MVVQKTLKLLTINKRVRKSKWSEFLHIDRLRIRGKCY